MIYIFKKYSDMLKMKALIGLSYQCSGCSIFERNLNQYGAHAQGAQGPGTTVEEYSKIHIFQKASANGELQIGKYQNVEVLGFARALKNDIYFSDK